MLQRKCEQCAAKYQPRVRWQKYCSKHCGDKVRLARHRAKLARQAKEPSLVPLLTRSIELASQAKGQPAKPWRPDAA